MKKLISSNLYNFLEFLGKNVNLYQNEGNLTLDTEVSHPFFNAIYLNNLTDLKRLTKSTRLIVIDKVSFCDAKNILEELGCFYAENTIGMAMNLDELEIIDNDKVYFKEVNEEELLKWLDPLMKSYKIPESLKEYSFNYFKDLMDSKLKHYTLSIDNKVVAACSLFFDRDSVGLYNVCTLIEYRNQGLGTYIVKKALNEAKVLGYKSAILQASVMGTNIYKKIGFTEYNKQSIFIYLKQ